MTLCELAIKGTDDTRYLVSVSSAYRFLNAEGLITAPAHAVICAPQEFCDKTTRSNEPSQTDYSYHKVIGWDWFYLNTILDEYSRYIIAWKFFTTIRAADVTDTLKLELDAADCDSATVLPKPRLLGDNCSSYVAADLANYLEERGMDHVRGAPQQPQSLGKIERWHQTMKSKVMLENYFLPGNLKRKIDAFVDHYSNYRYHKSLDNLTHADVYHRRDAKILKM